ncbi:MAG: alpha/beta fold hydrolase [Candidatus Neomarinimicrobiota bacterium]|nr:alpha/beta fold hydrolase [Candidatus Neomarinimicrobiota bacterium]MDD3966858.1 alpha/beta fold hydrolase [Candidatus Neomarinimicrobiota bacterium]MDX9779831.1 alpha/beta fold hydrolase [bacterium]
MKRSLFIPLVFLFFLSVLFAGTDLQFAELGDLHLENGQSILDFRAGYRIYGSIDPDSSNIILYPSWFGGTSEHIGALIRIHAFIDTARFAVLAFDAPGNGVSTSPSNSRFQPGAAFPGISIADMAAAARLLLKKLHIDRLYAIVGGSMGGMQAFEFITAYPDMAAKAVIYVATPQTTAYDLLRWEAARRTIELGRTYAIPESEYMLPLQITQALNGKSPAFFACEMPREEVPDFLTSYEEYRPGNFSADNFYCQSGAIIRHDISRHQGGDLKKTAAGIRSRLLLIVNKQDHLVAPWPAIDFAGISGAKLLVLDNNRGHLGITYEIGKVRKTIDRFLRQRQTHAK